MPTDRPRTLDEYMRAFLDYVRDAYVEWPREARDYIRLVQSAYPAAHRRTRREFFVIPDDAGGGRREIFGYYYPLPVSHSLRVSDRPEVRLLAENVQHWPRGTAFVRQSPGMGFTTIQHELLHQAFDELGLSPEERMKMLAFAAPEIIRFLSGSPVYSGDPSQWPTEAFAYSPEFYDLEGPLRFLSAVPTASPDAARDARILLREAFEKNVRSRARAAQAGLSPDRPEIFVYHPAFRVP